jgi:hypothetical protein
VSIRSVDHLVLPVAELARARARLSALGFTVAPEALHPFGTANACVFLPDGTYLEPLAIANRRTASAAAKRGNVFTCRDIAFRKTRNREGLSALVAASEDAEADDRRFLERDLSAGKMLEFSRPVSLPDGSEDTASFRLAFAGHADATDFFLFACQRTAPLPAERGDLEIHANAVIGLSEIVLTAPRPDDTAPLLETVFEAQAAAESENLVMEAANARVRVLREEDLFPEFALAADPSHQALTGRIVIFKSADLAVTEITLAANDVTFIRREGRVLVAAAPGQGVMFGFEE